MADSRVESILKGYELEPPLSRVEKLLYDLRGSISGGMSEAEIKAYIDEQLANSQGLPEDFRVILTDLKEWLAAGNEDLSEFLDRLKVLEESGPYAKIKYVDELPGSDEADLNTIYMIESNVDGVEHYLKYQFVEELPSEEEIDPDTIYMLLDSNDLGGDGN